MNEVRIRANRGRCVPGRQRAFLKLVYSNKIMEKKSKLPKNLIKVVVLSVLYHCTMWARSREPIRIGAQRGTS